MLSTEKNLLRYQIDNWSQIVDCQSNSSPLLHITYSAIIDNRLSGEVVRVEHDKFGCLFSYLVNGSGKLLIPGKEGLLHEWTPEEILLELEKYGFYIEFRRIDNIPGEQLSLLIDIDRLGMDKIRYMYVDNTKVDSDICPERTYKGNLVAFSIEAHPSWLNNTYVCSYDEFSNALVDGTALNLAAMKNAQKYNWAFLRGKVLNIKDILEASESIYVK